MVEVLAALALMAIVIPVVMRGLQIASLAGSVSQRKALAARIGERLLNESVVNAQWNRGGQSGTEQQGPYEFRWVMRNEVWKPTIQISQDAVTENAIHQVSVDVSFAAQGKSYAVSLSTLVNVQQQ